MRFCLFDIGTGATPTAGRLGLVRARMVVDAHNACVASLAGHMPARRAVEIASNLCPPDLLGFLENGRQGRRALEDCIDDLGERIGDPDLTTPAGAPVVAPSRGLRLLPLAPWHLRWTPASTGQWRGVTLPLEGPLPTTLHTDGRPYIHELLAVIGTVAEAVEPDGAWSHIALVTELHPSNRAHVGLLRTTDDLEPGDEALPTLLARVVSEASRRQPLLVGDVVRTGRALLASGAPQGEDGVLELDNSVGAGH